VVLPLRLLRDYSERLCVSLGYLLAILNSSLYFQWLFHRGKRKGKMLEMFQTPLSEIPIKRISRTEQRQFIELTDRITQLKRTDTTRNTTDLEQKVDELVNALYGLTAGEVELLSRGQREGTTA
jgi:adenine-specific DNA-methyltransferase